MSGYVTLISDASRDFFPDNKQGRFRIKLPKKIKLDRTRHQLGLKYMSYPRQWHNVADGKLSLYFWDGTNYETAGIQFDTRIAAGHYNGPRHVIETLNAAIRHIQTEQSERYQPILDNGYRLENNDVRFRYSVQTKKIHVTALDSPHYKISMRLSKELFVKLGLGLEEDITRVTGDCCDFFDLPTKAPMTADLTAGRSAIYVYSDVIEPTRIVGNRLVPLLAICPVTCTRGTQCYYEPRVIEYCEPRYDELDQILIELTGDTGDILDFVSGKTYVTLHIKDRFAAL